jgi:Icc-related predicted phosphoesterase
MHREERDGGSRLTRGNRTTRIVSCQRHGRDAPMRIGIMSDLHLEFDAGASRAGNHSAEEKVASVFYANPPEPNADILVLAGDIHGGAQAVAWVVRHFAIPVILIGGNHEPYGRELFRVIACNRQRAGATNGRVVFLERATWTYGSVASEQARFIGATLWTDFQLYGTPQASMEIAQQRLADFSVIEIERGTKLRPLRPSDTVRLYTASVAFLRNELSQPFDGVTVVITHHAPSRRSIGRKFQNDPLNPAFASDLEELIQAYAPSLWIHGHMHDSFDYVIGGTRIICNPRGYFPDQLNPNFDPYFTVEISGGQRRRDQA